MASDNGALSLGLVISGQAIYAAATRTGKSGPEVVARATTLAPDGAVQGGSIVDPTRTGQAIRGLVQSLGVRTAVASVALMDPLYAMRAVRLPEVPDRERRKLIRNELEEAGALPVGGGAFDFIWSSNAAGGPEGQRLAEAYAYYTSDQEVDHVRAALHAAGLQLGEIEPASLCAMRSYMAALPTGEPVALLSLARKHADLCICDEAQVRQLRRIPAGFDDLDAGMGGPEPLVSLEPVGPTDHVGRLASANPHDESVPGFSVGSDLASGLEGPGMQNSPPGYFLASEVARSLAFYSREFPDAQRTASLAVLGPIQATRSLENVLAGQVNIPLSEIDPFIALELPQPAAEAPGADDPRFYAIAVGVAFGSARTLVPVVDISKQEQIAHTRRRAPSVLLAGMTGSTIWMILAASAAIGLNLMESSAQSENSRLASEIKRVQAEQAPKIRYQQVLTAAKAMQKKNEIPAPAVLGRVAASSTPGIGLTDLKLESGAKVNMDGRARDTRCMQQFVLALNRGKSVKAPKYAAITQNDKGEITFHIVGSGQVKE